MQLRYFKKPEYGTMEYLGFVRNLAGITCEVRGLENIPKDRAVLYVGNHRSYFDIVMGYTTVPSPTGFIAKKMR